MPTASWSIPAHPDEVAGIRSAAVEFARAQGVPDRHLEQLRLALSEAVTNSVVHAFRKRARLGTVTVTIDVTGTQLEAVVTDDGIGMSARDDSPGLGLGLGLISSVVDAVEHRVPPDGVGFVLWMRFRFSAVHRPPRRGPIGP